MEADGRSIGCQVIDCDRPLPSTVYHRRYRICAFHSGTSTFVIDGEERRWCQQCAKYHGLDRFDPGRRSCREKLKLHNEYRRRSREEKRQQELESRGGGGPGGTVKKKARTTSSAGARDLDDSVDEDSDPGPLRRAPPRLGPSAGGAAFRAPAPSPFGAGPAPPHAFAGGPSLPPLPLHAPGVAAPAAFMDLLKHILAPAVVPLPAAPPQRAAPPPPPPPPPPLPGVSIGELYIAAASLVANPPPEVTPEMLLALADVLEAHARGMGGGPPQPQLPSGSSPGG